MSMVNELTYLINDSLSGRVALFANGAEKYTDQAIREAFFEILGDDKLTYQNFRNNKISGRSFYRISDTWKFWNLGRN